MDYHYVTRNSKAYSPKGVQGLFEQAVKKENNDIEQVFRKREYQTLRELWYASFLALALKKWLNEEFSLNPANPDPPDVYFLDQNNRQAFAVEIMELFFYDQINFNGDYHELAQKIWDTKGTINYKKCYLLIVCRIQESKFNITKLAQEIKKFDWNFERIWLSIFTSASSTWTFFELHPSAQNNDKANITFSYKDKSDMEYFY